jgi:site-specific DNA recombinase
MIFPLRLLRTIKPSPLQALYSSPVIALIAFWAIAVRAVGGFELNICTSSLLRPAALSDLLSSGRLVSPNLHLHLAAPFIAQGIQLDPQALEPAFLAIQAPFQLRRRGVETRIAAGQMSPRPDPALLRILAQAHLWTDRLRTGTPLADVARDAGHSDAYIRTRAPLAFLSPRIQCAILDGTHAPDLTLERIVRTGVPLDWREQAQLFGFD